MTHRDWPEGEIVCVVGAPGSGKSLAIADALTHDLVAGRRVIALDLSSDLARYLEERGVESIARVSTIDSARGVMASRARAVVYSLSPKVPAARTTQDWLTHAVELHQEGDVFVCDEAELVFPNGRRADGAIRLIKLARNWRIRLIVASQRPQLLDSLLRCNATHVCVFRSDSRLFVEGCQEFGDPALFAPSLSLPRHHYLYRPRFAPPGPLRVIDALEEPAPWIDAEAD